MNTLHPQNHQIHQKHPHRRHKKHPRSLRRRILITATLLLITLGILFQCHSSLPQGNFASFLASFSEEKAGSGASNTSGENDPEDSNWQLILVNRQNPIPSGYHVELTKLKNNQTVDSRIYPDLQQMFDDARAAGILPQITSSYRTSDKQQQLMEEKIADYQAEGYSPSKAKELAEEWVALPGTSEHEIGLAVDISTEDSSVQDASIVWEWLLENSYKYGFIRRYPEDKTGITGVIHEPWHFRYVGKEAAKEIYEQDLCLEEYLHQTGGN